MNIHIQKPTPFKHLDMLFPTQFKMCNGVIDEKRGDECFVDGKLYNLGNPEYLCYPLNYSLLMINSYSKNYKKDYYRIERALKRREKRFKSYYQRPRGNSECPYCGKQMYWCSFCQMYSSNCCQDWGTCQCS